MTEAVRAEWQEIYGYLKKIKAMKPWEYLDSMTPVMIDYGGSRASYVTVIGSGGDSYGLLIYDDTSEYCKAMCQYMRPSTRTEAYMFSHRSISVMWDEKDHISEDNIALLDGMGISFRGNNWVNISKTGGRYLPKLPNSAERKRLIKDLKNLADALGYVKKKSCPDSGMRAHYTVRKDDPSFAYDELDITSVMENINYSPEDSDIPERLRAMKTERYSVQINMYYLAVTDRSSSGSLFYPEIFVAADNKSGEIAYSSFNEENYPEEDFIFEAVKELCAENGKPSGITVCDRYIYAVLDDLCRRAGIKLTLRDRPLEKTDEFINEFDSGLDRIMAGLLNGSFDENAFAEDPLEFMASLLGYETEPQITVTSSSRARRSTADGSHAPEITVTSRTAARKEKAPDRTFIISVSCGKNCRRDIAIPDGASFGKLHEVILKAFGLSGSHNHEFFLDNKAGSKKGKLTKGDGDSSYSYALSEHLKKGQRFLLVTDIDGGIRFDCRLEDTEDKKCGRTRVIRSVGENPQQSKK